MTEVFNFYRKFVALSLHGPFRAGDSVEVIVLSAGSRQLNGKRYPLQGTPYTFTDPFGT